jgi:hypothetical protein
LLKHVSNGLEVCANASKHVFTTSDEEKYLFFLKHVSILFKKMFLMNWKCVKMHQNAFAHISRPIETCFLKPYFLRLERSKMRFDAFAHTFRPLETRNMLKKTLKKRLERLQMRFDAFVNTSRHLETCF